jgi:hypothetical protein
MCGLFSFGSLTANSNEERNTNNDDRWKNSEIKIWTGIIVIFPTVISIVRKRLWIFNEQNTSSKVKIPARYWNEH